MIINEVNEKITSHTKHIDSDIYTFEIIVLRTKYFNNENEILSKMIKNIKVNEKKANKNETSILVASIRADAKEGVTEYKSFDSFKTENQHYVKNKIQKNWDKSDCVIFQIKDDVTDKEILDYSLTGTLLINYDNISHDKSQFESNNTFVKKHTFDIYGDDYFIYLEDGIVTVLEKLFERIIGEYSYGDLREIKNTKETNIIKYFFTPYLDNRIENYHKFAININKDYKEPKVITDFFEKEIEKSLKNLKCFIKNADDNIFNLTSDWIEYLFYSQLYEECAAHFARPVIMPYSPTKALFILDEASLQYFKKYTFDKEDFLLNVILSIIDKRLNTSGDEVVFPERHYEIDTLIRLADKKNTEEIVNMFNNYFLVKDFNLKKLSLSISTYWINKNMQNINENIDEIHNILKEQHDRIVNYLKKHKY